MGSCKCQVCIKLLVLYSCLQCLNYTRPQNKEELYNLRHASLRNAIERIFGVLKRRFRILLIAPEYNLEIQARIPAALCAIHNFIQEHDPNEGELEEERNVFNEGLENEGGLPAPEVEPVANLLQDQIAQDMWDQYQQLLAEREALGDFFSSESGTDIDD
jgi:hypothetical protein